jgi:hypothetical protein
MGLLFARAATAAVVALLRPMLARPLPRSVANIPVAAGVYCAGATAVLTVLAGVSGTGSEEEEAPLPPSAMQTGQGTPAIKTAWSSNRANGQEAIAMNLVFRDFQAEFF